MADEIHCRRCEGTNIRRMEQQIGTEEEPCWFISQTCQDCKWQVIVRDDAYPENNGREREALFGYRQPDGTIVW